MMINKSFADRTAGHCTAENTIIYEDDRVVLVRNKYGTYVEFVKQTLEEILRDDPDECVEEAIEVLRERGLSNIRI